MTVICITNPIENDHCITAVYIGYVKNEDGTPDVGAQSLFQSESVIPPGKTETLFVFRGFGSVSIHEGLPVTREKPADITDAGNKS